MHRILALCLALPLAAGVARAYQIGDPELLTMPTAWTMVQGQSCFTDYELIFLNYNFAVTDRTHVGVFSLFPMTVEMLTSLILGLKQSWLQGERYEAALWATYSPDFGGLTVGNVLSIGQPAKSLHLGVSAAMGLEGSISNTEFLFMGGFRNDLGERLSVLGEYYTSSSMLDDGFVGLFSIGLRWRGEDLAVDFGGMRPLSDTGDLLFIPYLKATVMFGASDLPDRTHPASGGRHGS